MDVYMQAYMMYDVYVYNPYVCFSICIHICIKCVYRFMIRGGGEEWAVGEEEEQEEEEEN